MLNFETSADFYTLKLVPEPKKTKFICIFTCLKSIFVLKSIKNFPFFIFKALELFLAGGCRLVFLHPVKIHAFEVLFCFMVYRRQPAAIWSNLHLKKSKLRQILLRF